MHSLKGVLRVEVAPAMTQMHLSEVTPTQESSDNEFFFQIEQNDKLFHFVDPSISLVLIVHVEVEGFALGHDNEPVHVLLRRVFEVMFLQAAVLDIQDSTFLSVIIILKQEVRVELESVIKRGSEKDYSPFTYIVLNNFIFDQDVVSCSEESCVFGLSIAATCLLRLLCPSFSSLSFLLRSFL